MTHRTTFFFFALASLTGCSAILNTDELPRQGDGRDAGPDAMTAETGPMEAGPEDANIVCVEPDITLVLSYRNTPTTCSLAVGFEEPTNCEGAVSYKLPGSEDEEFVEYAAGDEGVDIPAFPCAPIFPARLIELNGVPRPLPPTMDFVPNPGDPLNIAHPTPPGASVDINSDGDMVFTTGVPNATRVFRWNGTGAPEVVFQPGGGGGAYRSPRISEDGRLVLAVDPMRQGYCAQYDGLSSCQEFPDFSYVFMEMRQASSTLYEFTFSGRDLGATAQTAFIRDGSFEFGVFTGDLTDAERAIVGDDNYTSLLRNSMRVSFFSGSRCEPDTEQNFSCRVLPTSNAYTHNCITRTVASCGAADARPQLIRIEYGNSGRPTQSGVDLMGDLENVTGVVGMSDNGSAMLLHRIQRDGTDYILRAQNAAAETLMRSMTWSLAGLPTTGALNPNSVSISRSGEWVAIVLPLDEEHSFIARMQTGLNVR